MIRGDIDPDVRALGLPGQVFAPGDWGRIVNGGAWLRVDGVAVDLIYRDLDEVVSWTDEAEQGRFEIQREVGYVAGIATYVLAGELALGEVLSGELPRPSFPAELRRTAPDLWNRLAAVPEAIVGTGTSEFAAIDLDAADIRESLFLNQGFSCAGQVRALGARIGGQLAMSAAVARLRSTWTVSLSTATCSYEDHSHAPVRCAPPEAESRDSWAFLVQSADWAE